MMVKFSLVLFLLLNNFYSSSPLVRLPDKTLDYQRLNQPVAAIKHYFPIFQQSLKGKKYYAIESPYTSMSSSHLVEVKVDSARKDIELAEKKLMAKIQNNFRILVFNLFKIGITILIILSIIAYIIYRQKKRASQRRYQTLKLEKEYQILQALIEGEEKERSRIAKDLHDGIAGTLAVIKMNFSTIQQGDPTFQDSSVFKNTLQLLDDVFREVRKTAHNLMPDLLLHYGLDESLNRYCRNISQSNTIHIDYLSIGDIIRLKANFELSVYRIAQELIHNVIKHANANRIFVQISRFENTLALTIEDNGCGFDPKSVLDGIGINSLKTRVKALSGSIEWSSSPENGTSVYVEFDVGEFRG